MGIAGRNLAVILASRYISIEFQSNVILRLIWKILLLFGLLFCFTPLLLLVFLYRNHCRYAFVETLYNIWFLQEAHCHHDMCLHSSLET